MLNLFHVLFQMRIADLISFRTRWLLIVATCCCAQLNAGISVRGTIKEQGSGQRIPYANVYYPAMRSGVVADLNGNFSLQVNAESDTLVFTAVGYKRLVIPSSQINDEVFLHPDATELKTVVIRATNDRYYFQLLDSCRKYTKVYKELSKAAFHQTSVIAEQQVEQLDAYYNAVCNGYELENLQLKTGLFGLKPRDGNFFISYENTKAITLLPVLSKPRYFPRQPLCMTVEQMLKNYFAEVDEQYRKENGDLMIRLTCLPKDTGGAFFYATYVVNLQRKCIEEIILKGSTDVHHPFVPNTGDSIARLDWDIHRSYECLNDTLYLQQIYFRYNTSYKRLRPSQPNTSFLVNTTAIIYFYQHGQAFILPSFDFGTLSPGDYSKINAYGFNRTFWSGLQDYRLTDYEQSVKFYNSPGILTDQHAFKQGAFGRSGLFEHPYVHWSRNRIRIRQTVSDTLQKQTPATTEREKYELEVKLFAELDTILGVTFLRTAVVMDPYESYWRLPEDSLAGVFINVFFDHCEIFRQRLESKYANQPHPHDLTAMQKEYRDWFVRFRETYFREVQRGRNSIALERYAAEAEKELVLRQFHSIPGDIPDEE